MLWGTIGGVTLLFCIFAFSQWSILKTAEKRQKVDLAEVSLLFDQAISDGTVQEVSGREFEIRQSRGGRVYIISFTNSIGEMSEVVVSPALERRDRWKFHQVTPETSDQVFNLKMSQTE